MGDPYSSSNLYLEMVSKLLRQLSHEFSLRSRTEGLSLRAAVGTGSFKDKIVQNLIRQIELACAKYTQNDFHFVG